MGGGRRLAIRGALALLLLPQPGAARAADILDLPVPAYGPAVVAVAGGGPHAVLVATHGSFDRPEWHCETWPPLVGDRLHVLCPRGTLRWDTPEEPHLRRYYYRGGERLEREIDAALQALRARLQGRVAEGPLVYLGFSQGAIYGVPLLQRRGALFPRAILVEGGAWTAQAARTYARLGGKRVLFACGLPGCFRRATASAEQLAAAGVQARVVHAPGTGHTYDGPVAAKVAAALPWLLGE